MDWSILIPWVCTSLNSPSIAELGAWTEDELYTYAEEALSDIAGKFILLAEVDDTIALAADQGLYELPLLHIATIFAAADGIALQPSTVAEMEALDDNWEEAASGTPARWVGNALGSGFIRAYPPPSIDGALTLIYQSDSPDLTAAAAEIKMPAPVGDYLAIKTLQQARIRQGDNQMLDAADTFGILAGVYEKAFEAYWGNGS